VTRRQGKSLHDLRSGRNGERGSNGGRLCTWCRKECEGRRRLWCSQECVDAYLAQAHQGGFRRAVERRDHGVCARCERDTEAIRRWILEQRRKGIRFGFGFPPEACWEADHVVPLAEGGAHSLENARTLCRPCHVTVTAELRARLALARRERIQPSLPIGATA